MFYMKGRKVMFEDEMKDRTKSFALRTIKLVESLPTTRTGDVIGKQLIRSAPQLERTIALLAVAVPKPISSLN
jgi:hypothetical protein